MASKTINDLTLKATPVSTDEIELQETAAGSSFHTTIGGITNSITLEQVRNNDNVIAGDIDFDGNGIVDTTSVGFEGGQALTWNTTDKTVDIPTGLGPTLQVGQESFIIVYNDTGALIPDGSVVYASGVSNGRVSIALAKSDSFETLTPAVSLCSMDIPNGSEGIVVGIGTVRGFDTSAWNVGDRLYVSSTTAGDLTNVVPEYPNYKIFVGAVLTSHATTGSILVGFSGKVTDTLQNFWNGSFREQVSFTVATSGSPATIVGSLAPAGSQPNLTLMFSDGFTTLDTTPPKTITLTAGTDTIPQKNFVYIPITTKVLTNSISDWPTGEHIKVAYIVLQSATATATTDALVNQNWNDPLENAATQQGHLLHVTERIRQLGASWSSGALGSMTINTGPTPDDVFVANTSGVVYQLHKQTFLAQDLATGDHAFVVNHNTTPYTKITNLNTQLLDANGVTLNNTSFSFVLWGVANKTGEASHLMLNLPTAAYAFGSPTDAVNDALNYSVFSIPETYKSVGFLIARFTCTYKNDVWTLEDTEDLRGKIPNATAGGGGGGSGVTEFDGLSDTPSSKVGMFGNYLRVNAGETSLEYVEETNFLSNYIETVSDKTHKLVVKIPHAGTITETTTISASGTCTATFKINTTALGGTANSVSSAEQSQAHASANAFVAGDDIQLTISSNSSCLDMSYTIKYTRVLE